MWTMHAHRSTTYRGQQYYAHFGEKWWVDLHGLDDPVVKVELTENPEGQYRGWIDESHGGNPYMVQAFEPAYRCQFPYGPEEEEKAGRGRTVRLDVKEVT